MKMIVFSYTAAGNDIEETSAITEKDDSANESCIYTSGFAP